VVGGVCGGVAQEDEWSFFARESCVGPQPGRPPAAKFLNRFCSFQLARRWASTKSAFICMPLPTRMDFISRDKTDLPNAYEGTTSRSGSGSPTRAEEGRAQIREVRSAQDEDGSLQQAEPEGTLRCR